MDAPADYTKVRCLQHEGEVYAPLGDDKLAGHSRWVDAQFGPGFFVSCRGQLAFKKV